MKVWLLMGMMVFLCTIRAAAYDTDHCNPEQVVGDWHILAFATDCKVLMKYLDNMEMMVASIDRQEDGHFKITSSVPTPFGCLKMEEVLIQNEDGTIVHKSVLTCRKFGMVSLFFLLLLFLFSSALGEESVAVTHTDCETYNIVTISRAKDQQNGSKYITLYARERQVPEEIEKMFRDYVHDLGFQDENMRFFEKEVNCIKE
ncbi:uncharacterized protein LOC121936435 [Sceloporus undulatus]|uniref:uncharacterized protein LOC121936435 n=1 Tax=Sceloporus undulatus TaxID=8520 RepID=UPI001C4C6C09|nr:uncharacterized protein LOC121936435 [Sceloporus undulatus]